MMQARAASVERLKRNNGHLMRWATIHPSAILRVPEKLARENEFAAFVRDLELARKSRVARNSYTKAK